MLHLLSTFEQIFTQKKIETTKKLEKRSNQEHTINAPIKLWVVCYLRVLTPNDFTCLSYQTELWYVHLQHGT